VTVGILSDRFKLRSGDSEIGDWPRDECEIIPNGAGSFLILAEGDELHFTPESSEEFAAALNPLEPTGTVSPQPSGTPVATPIGDNPLGLEESTTEPALPSDMGEASSEPHAVHHEILDGPEPGSVTVGLFYLLAALTALLGLWAALTLII
jgi:hypothetical protein